MTTPSAERFRRFTRSVFQAQTALLEHGDVANADFGQSSARWRVLLRVSTGETPVAAVARSTGYSRQAVQRLAGALVAGGLARYSADPDDRRQQVLELTEAGAATFERLAASFGVRAGRLTARLPAAELIAAAETLDRVRDVLLADVDYLKRPTR